VASQIEHDVDGYLVNNIPQCAWFALRLLRDPVLHTRMGQAAREKVRSRFLLPRMLRDYLLLVRSSVVSRIWLYIRLVRQCGRPDTETGR